MDIGLKAWTYTLVGLSFALYIGIAVWSRVKTTRGFYVAGGGVSPLANGMATAADWMSAASFISMAGIISFSGRDGAYYLMGWTGGYVLLALFIAPYLRKFGQFTVPDFMGERYYSKEARLTAVVCALFVSFTYVAGQMRGVGVVFSRFLDVDIGTGVLIGMGIVFFYAVMGGMKGITYTQVAQYCVLIFAFLVPAIFISLSMTGEFFPQVGFGSTLLDDSGANTGVYLLDKLDGLHEQLGFAAYTSGTKETIDIFFITAALMVGTAGLPHVVIRFFTVRRVRDARLSAGYALLFIALLYTTAPALAAFARTNLITTVHDKAYSEMPEWFEHWEKTGLLAWVDKNADGRIQYAPGSALDPVEGQTQLKILRSQESGRWGEPIFRNPPSASRNELHVDRDIIVLANPEIARLPNWVIALVAAGGLAAALSTAAGLLLVISASISHDLLKNILLPKISEKQELLYARISAGVAVCIAGYFGINPPGFVAQVVAFAFGLAAASLFPAIVLGIFYRRMNREGAISGMVVGIVFTAAYISYFKFVNPSANHSANWLFGISPEGIGTLGMLINVVVSLVVCRLTPAPPSSIGALVDRIRVPRDSDLTTR